MYRWSEALKNGADTPMTQVLIVVVRVVNPHYRQGCPDTLHASVLHPCHEYHSMLQKTLRAQILALLSGSLLAMLLIALACFHFLSSGVQSYANLIDGPLHTSQLIDEANLQFKVQVQEWKNVLLRGKQPADLDKYWKQFEDRQRDVQGILGELAGQNGIEPLLKTRIERLRDEHRLLGAAYQKGRDAYVAAGADPTAGDTAVKGVDRATSDQMSELVSELRKQGVEQSKLISASADRTVLLGIIVMLASGLLIGLLSLWLVNRNLIEPIRKLIEYVAQLSQGKFADRLLEKLESDFMQQFTDGPLEVGAAGGCRRLHAGRQLVAGRRMCSGCYLGQRSSSRVLPACWSRRCS